MNAAAQTHERADGAARIEFGTRPDGPTVLTDLYQRAPCRVLFPIPETGEPLQAVLLNTSGGLTGGDRIHVEIEVRAHARVTVTTQAAEKLYRALAQDSETRIDVSMKVGRGAWAEWLAQETILFDGARLRRRFHADVAPQARLLAVETVVFGRTAMGEWFDTGFLHDAWRIRRGGRLIWADALHLEGHITQVRQSPFGFGTAVACSSLVYVGDDAARLLGEARSLLSECYVHAAATTFDDLLLVRLLADDAAELRSVVVALIGGLRKSAAGLPPQLPRVWHC